MISEIPWVSCGCFQTWGQGVSGVWGSWGSQEAEELLMVALQQTGRGKARASR